MTTDRVRITNPDLPVAKQVYRDETIEGLWHRAVVHDRGATVEGRCGETLWPDPVVMGLRVTSEAVLGEGSPFSARCHLCFPPGQPDVTVGAAFRRFALWRDEDQTGVSGTGTVAEGVQFGDGRCAMRWLTPVTSGAFYDSISDVESIHGHNGATKVVWLDD